MIERVQWEWALTETNNSLVHTSLKFTLWTQQWKTLQAFPSDFLNHQIKNPWWKCLTSLWQSHVSQKTLVSNQTHLNCSSIDLSTKPPTFPKSMDSEKPICGLHQRTKVKFFRVLKNLQKQTICIKGQSI